MMEKAAFDAYAADYDEALNRGLSLSGESKQYFARARIQWTASRLADIGHHTLRVLDYGCGTGDSATELLEQLRASAVTGVDASSESIAVARREHAGSTVEFHTIDGFEPSGTMILRTATASFTTSNQIIVLRALTYVNRSLIWHGYFALWEQSLESCHAMGNASDSLQS